ncbi:uncharacterized protein N7446_000275, partial [Penicillium canescens]
NGASAVKNNDLATYYKSESDIDIIVLAFLNYEPRQYDTLAAAIQQCQLNRIKVILSLGGVYLISKLRSNFASNSSSTYYITATPQCFILDPNIQEVVTAAQFDYL